VQLLRGYLAVDTPGAAHHQGETVDAVRLPLPVLHPYLGFAVQGEIGNQLLFLSGNNLARQFVGQIDGQGHEHRRLPAGEPEDRGLLPHQDLFNFRVRQLPFIKIEIRRGRVFLETGEDAGGLRIEIGPPVADLADDLPG